MVNRRRKSKLNLFVVLLTILLGVLFYFNINTGGKKLIDIPRYMVFGKENAFVVLEDKLSLKFPYEIQVNSENTLKDLYDAGRYDEMKEALNKLLPEKIDDYKVIKKGEVDINVAYKYNVPEATIEDKNYVLTSSLNELFRDKYYKSQEQQNSNVIIDVLNGNGVPGYAGRAGEKIKDSLGYKYNAANYERDTDYSYVINKDLTPSQLNKLVLSLNEKYIKIKSEVDIPTLANAVVILGKEQNINTKIKIYGTNAEVNKGKRVLEDAGYKNISGIEDKGTTTVVQYSGVNYYTAYKIAKKLGIKNMIKTSLVKDNEIKVYYKKK